MLLKNKLPRHTSSSFPCLQKERSQDGFSHDLASVRNEFRDEKIFCSIFSREFLAEHKQRSSAHWFIMLRLLYCFQESFCHSNYPSDRRNHFLKFLIELDNLTWRLAAKLSLRRFPSTARWEKTFDVDLLENCHTCSHWSSPKKKESLKYCSRLRSEKTFFHFSRSH